MPVPELAGLLPDQTGKEMRDPVSRRHAVVPPAGATPAADALLLDGVTRRAKRTEARRCQPTARARIAWHRRY